MNSNTVISKKFSVSLIWNIAESFAYHIIFATHHCYAYLYTDSYVYGQSGTYFSLMYCAISIFSSGFEESLSFSYNATITSKTNFTTLLLRPIAAQIMWATLFFSVSVPAIKLFFSIPLLQIPAPLLCVMLGIIVSEITRKSLRRFLHISFFNATTALSEIALIVLYVLIVWNWYVWTGVFTLAHLLVPMLFASAISSSILIIKTARLYYKLPCVSEKVSYATRIKKHRMYNYASQCIHQIFSGNILIPLIAAYYGFNKAGVLELVRNIIYFVSILLNKVIGPSAEALLAHKIKEEQEHYQTVFNYARTMSSFLIWIGTFLSIGLFFSHIEAFNVRLSVTVFILYLLENTSIFYERLLRVQGHAQLIFKLNIGTLCLSALLLPCLTSSPAYTYIGLLSLIKAVHVAVLHITVQRKDFTWDLSWIKRSVQSFKKQAQKES
jgi:hypothetical protein